MNDATKATHPARLTPKSARPIALTLLVDPPSMAEFLDLLRESLESIIGKALTQMSAAPSSPQQAAAPPPPISTAAKGIDLKPGEQAKAADHRMALLMGKIPEDTGVLIDTRALARLLTVSSRHVCRLLDEKAIPDPVRLGRLVRWRLAEILDWIEADCPPERVWVHKRQDASKKKGR